MGQQGQGIDRTLYGAPWLTSLFDHSLVVTAVKQWPRDNQVKLLAAETACIAEAAVRGCRRRAQTEPRPTWARTMHQTMLEVRWAACRFPSPEVDQWVTQSEQALLDAAIGRFTLEAVLIRLAESAVVGGSSSS